MSLLNPKIDLGQGVNSLLDRVLPKRARPIDPEKVRTAITHNDFPGGFVVEEYQNGKVLEGEGITLIGNRMIQQPFEFGGKQRLKKQYYPGNSEPTMQVLGAEETNITVKGRFYDKRYSGEGEKGRAYGLATELQQQVESVRLRGNLLRLSMGEFKRWGFLEEAKFTMKTLGDVEYELAFSIVSFNKPKDSKIPEVAQDIPLAINKQLISTTDAFILIPKPPDLSFADQVAGLINDVASAMKLVTNFVDGVLNEVDDVRQSVFRALGLIKYAQNTALRFAKTVGAFQMLSTTKNPLVGVSSKYSNAAYFQTTMSGTNSLLALLARLAEQLRQISRTIPLARHRVIEGDTLQKLSVKFYNTSEKWKLIYDHNKLLSPTLTLGVVLEIPRD